MNRRQLGAKYEAKTVDILRNDGYEILQCNVYTPFGEIDIIARYEGLYIFAEVKYRQNSRFGSGADAVTYHKRQHIVRASKWFLMKHVCHEVPVRYDVASWTNDTLNYYKGAFHGE